MDAVLELNCPNCGAGVEPDGKVCGYCGSTFTISRKTSEVSLTGRKCPACGTMNPPDGAYCEHCAEKLLDECRNCKKPVPIGSNACRFCGGVHHAKKRKSNPDLEQAMKLSVEGEFAEADDLFSAGEGNNKDNPRFYAAWINNYTNWSRSFEGDMTMQTFVHEYRSKAKDLVGLVEEKFSDDPFFQAARDGAFGKDTPVVQQAPAGTRSAFMPILFIVLLTVILAGKMEEGTKILLVIMLVVVFAVFGKKKQNGKNKENNHGQT